MILNNEIFGTREIEKSSVSDEDMEKINKMTLRKYGKDEIFTFCVKLCDNEVDRDFQRFSVEALHELAEMFKGVTGIEDHNQKSGGQRSRIYDTEVVEDRQRETSCGEFYTYLKAYCYTPRTDANRDFCDMLESGMKKEVSVGCSVGKICCGICGEDRINGGCEHIQGKEYDGVLCADVLSEARDAYEWSFVAVPAQREAGVIKSKSLKEVSDNPVVRSNISRLEKDAENGRIIKNSSDRKLIAMAAGLFPDMDIAMFAQMCRRLSFPESENLIKAFSGSFQGVQTAANTDKGDDMREFMI